MTKRAGGPPYYTHRISHSEVYGTYGPDGQCGAGNEKQAVQLADLLNRAYGLGAAAVVEAAVVSGFAGDVEKAKEKMMAKGYCICGCLTDQHERVDENVGRCRGCGKCTRLWDEPGVPPEGVAPLDKSKTAA